MLHETEPELARAERAGTAGRLAECVGRIAPRPAGGDEPVGAVVPRPLGDVPGHVVGAERAHAEPERGHGNGRGTEVGAVVQADAWIEHPPRHVRQARGTDLAVAGGLLPFEYGWQ